MNVQGGRTLLYTVASPADEAQLRQQLVDIGHSQIVKFRNRAHLENLVCDSVFTTMVILVTQENYRRDGILDILGLVKTLPVFGLFSRDTSNDPRIVRACNEVATWPCSEQELDFRIRKINDCCHNRDPGQSLFVRMNILGNSPEFKQVLDKVCKIRKCDAPVFVDGETGTGKELIARAIHYLSARADMPFIAVNCGAFPDQLIENELFGHVKGAYTDARDSSEGLIAQAEGGTLFLDEIETLSSRGQVALLRFLENMTYRPLGGKRTELANVRVITATNESISDMVEDGGFRKDLFYRINIMNICLPPLRDRAGDISLLAEHFIRQYQVQYDEPGKVLHPETRKALKYHDWPGNVRELENLLHREFVMAEGNEVVIDEIESMTRERRNACCDRRLRNMFTQPMVQVKHRLVSDFEQQYLASALNRAKGNISEAARLAGKERRSFTRLLDKYHLDSAHYKGR